MQMAMFGMRPTTRCIDCPSLQLATIRSESARQHQSMHPCSTSLHPTSSPLSPGQLSVWLRAPPGGQATGTGMAQRRTHPYEVGTGALRVKVAACLAELADHASSKRAGSHRRRCRWVAPGR